MVSLSSPASSTGLSRPARMPPPPAGSRTRSLAAGSVSDASVRVLAPLDAEANVASARPVAWWRRPAAIVALAGTVVCGVAASAFWAGQQSAPEGTATDAGRQVSARAAPVGAATAGAGAPDKSAKSAEFAAVAQRSVLAQTPAEPAQRTPAVTGAAADEAANRAGADGPAVAPVCARCGVVESVRAVQHKGQGTGVGAVTGGVLGGVLGHQMGGGHGKDAMTVLGALGGGLAGNEVEKRARAVTTYQVLVRLDNGQSRTVEQASAPGIGTRVRVEGQALKPLR